jgi:hypothetical protein
MPWRAQRSPKVGHPSSFAQLPSADNPSIVVVVRGRSPTRIEFIAPLFVQMQYLDEARHIKILFIPPLIPHAILKPDGYVVRDFRAA